MLGLCLAIALMFLLVCAGNDWARFRYRCPQCGSTNGDHHRDCSWKD